MEFNKEDDLYFVIGTEDGYFSSVDEKEYIKAKQRLKMDSEGIHIYG